MSNETLTFAFRFVKPGDVIQQFDQICEVKFPVFRSYNCRLLFYIGFWTRNKFDGIIDYHRDRAGLSLGSDSIECLLARLEKSYLQKLVGQFCEARSEAKRLLLPEQARSLIQLY